MGKYFGTDGFRGEANVKLTADHAFRVGRYLGWYYGRDHKAKIVIGKDTRRSSYMFEYALAAGLTASGADAYLLHVTTTPSVSYVVRTEDFDCGIMISASIIRLMIMGSRSLMRTDRRFPQILKHVSRHIWTARSRSFRWQPEKISAVLWILHPEETVISDI